MSDTEFRIGMCGLCGGPCAIGANVCENKILSVEKLKNHPFLPGDICVRGAALKQYVHHPDRIHHPMKKVNGHFEEITWEQAISEITARLLETRAESGARSTVFYSGHPKWYRRALADLAAGYGSPNFCSESSTCNSATQIAWKLVCGSGNLMPDMKNTRTHIIWSNNMAGSTGYISSIAGLKKRGINLIVVDPRITPVTELADVHLQLIPGTDGALALGIANVIISRGLQDQAYIDAYATGFDEYKEYVSAFTPERTAEITGVPAELIEKAALIIAEGRITIKSSSCAVVHSVNGVQNFRAMALLSVLTGSLGSVGGNTFSGAPKASLNTFHHNLTQRPCIDEDITGDAFPVWDALINNEAQCEGLADIILNEKPYKIRNFIGFGLNLDMWPRPDRMYKAFESIEFKVVTDLFWTPAARMADYVLPAAAYPERQHVVVGKGNHLVFVDSIIDPEDKLPDVEIMLRMAHALGAHGEVVDNKDYLDYLNYTMLGTGVSIQELMDAPEGIDARKVVPGKIFNFEKDIKTPSGKFEFVSTLLGKYPEKDGYDALPVFHDFRDTAGDTSAFPYVLTAGPRKTYYFHSRTYRMPWLANLESHPNARISSRTAGRIGVTAGDRIKVTTPVSSLEFMVEIDDGLLDNSVYIIHEVGDNNVNLLLDDHYIDPISGFPSYRSYICNIEKA